MCRKSYYVHNFFWIIVYYFHKPDLEDGVTGHDTEVNQCLSVSPDIHSPSA